jgi:hypothetical protein
LLAQIELPAVGGLQRRQHAKRDAGAAIALIAHGRLTRLERVARGRLRTASAADILRPPNAQITTHIIITHTHRLAIMTPPLD